MPDGRKAPSKSSTLTSFSPNCIMISSFTTDQLTHGLKVDSKVIARSTSGWTREQMNGSAINTQSSLTLH